jgi:hypothetical protein
LRWRRASSSRSGLTQFHPEIFDLDSLSSTFSVFVFQTTLENDSFVIDFHVLALPGISRAHHDARLEKSLPTAPISSSVIKI